MQNKTKIMQFTMLTLWVCLLTSTVLVQAKASKTGQSKAIQSGEPDQTPNGISAPEWSSIQQQIKTGKYRAYANGGYTSSNPAHGWQIRYSNTGTTTLSPHDSQTPSYHLGMTLKAIGYQTLQQLGQPQQTKADNSTVTYQWNDTIKEWWINSPTRLEQWFKIAKRPKDASNGVPLTLRMTLDSELQARQSENSIQFTDATGTKITYDKLKVWDATGRTLPAKMQLTNNILSLIVEDGDAHYPLTIDPSFQQQAYLKASNADGGDLFGIAIAIDGDTLVIGAPTEASSATTVNGDQSDNSAFGAGAAYVFTRNNETWTQQTYLKASNADIDDSFGSSVAISGDTLVVSATGEESNTTRVNGDQNNNSSNNVGAAYVFNFATSTTAECTLNADGNASVDALTDGLLLMRYLFGFRGDNLTAGAVASDCVNCSAAELEPILEQCATAVISDIDGNGEVDALTDGLLIMRFLFGTRDDALTEGSVANNCSRCSVLEIETYLQPLSGGTNGPGIGNKISGVAWLDSNGNDVQDDNEPGAELITVTVTDESIPITRSTYTDSNGRYEFTDIPPSNSYQVSVKQDSQTNVEVSDTETAIVNLSVNQLRNIIQVDGITCSLQDAITSSIKNQSTGGCSTGIDGPTGLSSVDTLIDLKPGSKHPDVTLRGFETQALGSLETEIKGNGSIIDNFSLLSSDAGNPKSVVLRDLIIGKVNNLSGALTLDQVTVENAVIQRELDSFTDVFNSTIGSFDAVSGSINSSTVHGDTKGATVIKNSTIDGTVFLDTFTHNSNILKNSTVAELAVIVEQQPSESPLVPQIVVKIEESRINGLLIDNFDSVIPEECYINAEEIFSTDIVNGSEMPRLKLTVDSQCLLN